MSDAISLLSGPRNVTDAAPFSSVATATRVLKSEKKPGPELMVKKTSGWSRP